MKTAEGVDVLVTRIAATPGKADELLHAHRRARNGACCAGYWPCAAWLAAMDAKNVTAPDPVRRRGPDKQPGRTAARP